MLLHEAIKMVQAEWPGVDEIPHEAVLAMAHLLMRQAGEMCAECRYKNIDALKIIAEISDEKYNNMKRAIKKEVMEAVENMINKALKFNQE